MRHDSAPTDTCLSLRQSGPGLVVRTVDRSGGLAPEERGEFTQCVLTTGTDVLLLSRCQYFVDTFGAVKQILLTECLAGSRSAPDISQLCAPQ